MGDESIISEDNIDIYEKWGRLEEALDNATQETLAERKKALEDFLKQHPGLAAERIK